MREFLPLFCGNRARESLEKRRIFSHLCKNVGMYWQDLENGLSCWFDKTGFARDLPVRIHLLFSGGILEKCERMRAVF